MYAEVDLRVSNQSQMALEGALRIRLAVDRDDEFATPSQQFIDGRILDVPAVRQINPRLTFRHGNTKHLTSQALKARCIAYASRPGPAKPVPKPHVEKRQ